MKVICWLFIFISHFWRRHRAKPVLYLEFPMSSYRTCRHLWGLVMLAPLSGCQVGNADVFSSGVGEILPLYWANLTTAVTVASMVSHPEDQKKRRKKKSDMNWNRLLTSADADLLLLILTVSSFWERLRLWGGVLLKGHMQGSWVLFQGAL